VTELIDRTLVDLIGDDVGRITDVISDSVDLSPAWLVVKVGRLGGEHLVPVAAVDLTTDPVVTSVAKEQVKAAPKVRSHNEPTGLDRDQLYRHYGLVH
jgi:hypothetical protein